MKSLKRFGLVLLCVFVVFGLVNLTFAAAAVGIKPSVTITLEVDENADDEAESLKWTTDDKTGFLKGVTVSDKGAIKFPKAPAKFASPQRAVDWAEQGIESIKDQCAALYNKGKGKMTKEVFDKTIEGITVVMNIAAGSYEGFAVSDMRINVIGKPKKAFSAYRVGQDDDEDITAYVVIGKGKGGSVVSADGGIVLLKDLWIEGGKSAVGGGVAFVGVYGGVIQNCYFEGNSAQYGAAIFLQNCKNTVINQCFATNNKITKQGKAGGSITVFGGENNTVINNRVGGNKTINGLCGGIAVYQGKKNAIVNNIVINNGGSKGYPNFQIIIGGAPKTEDDETSKVTGLVVDGNIVMGLVKTNKNKALIAKNEYGIAEEIGERGNEFIDLQGHKLINNGFVTGSLNYAYRNSVGPRQYKNIPMDKFDDVNYTENTGAKAIKKTERNELVFAREGWNFKRRYGTKDLRKDLRPNMPTK